MTAVMGLDGSLAATGLCAPNGVTYLITTNPAHDRGRRLHALRTEMRYYLRRFPADLAVIELVPPMIRSVDTAVALGMAQGVMREILAEYGVPVGDVTNSTLKLFGCGKGNADKAEMIAAANRHRVMAERDIVDDNEADAWWLRAMGLWHLGERIVGGSADSFLHADEVREKSVHGPWPVKRGRPVVGAKWPGSNGARSAPRRRPAGPPAAAKSG